MTQAYCNEQDISLIAAYSENRVIGNNGKIPWTIEGEQHRFKELTTGNVVIMGRNTFCEILNKLKKPLPGRINIIISSTENYSKLGCPTFSCLKDALSFCKENYSEKKIYISGGERLYKEALPLCRTLFLTQVHLQIEGDSFFPQFDLNEYELIESLDVKSNIDFTYQTFVRKLQ